MNDSVLHEGFLSQSSSKLGFKQRWFCRLLTDRLDVHKDPERPISRTIELSSSTRIHVLEEDEFSIIPESGDPIVFSVAKDQLSEWVIKLRQATCHCLQLSMDSFEIITVLGRGNYGKVMLCRRLNSTRLYAIKAIKKANVAAANSVMSERNIILALDHPFIVKMVFAFQSPSKVYFGLEYVPGGSLYRLLRVRGAFGVNDARLYGLQVAIALHHLHELKVLYRDLKPDNVLIDADGYLVLTDFGLSAWRDRMTDTRSTFCGTQAYLAPEMIERRTYGISVDWWAFGILMYEMLMGVTPFKRSSEPKTYQAILSREPSFPAGFDRDARDLIGHLLVKVPEGRLAGKAVLAHPFFAGVDREALLTKKLAMPFVPTIVDGVGVFEDSEDELPIDSRAEHIPSSVSFEGFSYTNASRLRDDAQHVRVDLLARSE
jgi:serine/threonine protein kinase